MAVGSPLGHPSDGRRGTRGTQSMTLRDHVILPVRKGVATVGQKLVTTWCARSDYGVAESNTNPESKPGASDSGCPESRSGLGNPAGEARTGTTRSRDWTSASSGRPHRTKPATLSVEQGQPGLAGDVAAARLLHEVSS